MTSSPRPPVYKGLLFYVTPQSISPLAGWDAAWFKNHLIKPSRSPKIWIFELSAEFWFFTDWWQQWDQSELLWACRNDEKRRLGSCQSSELTLLPCLRATAEFLWVGLCSVLSLSSWSSWLPFTSRCCSLSQWGDSAQRQWSWAPHLLDHDSWAMEPHPQNFWQFRGSWADRVFGICPQSSSLGSCGFGLSPRLRLLGWLQETQRPLRRNGVLYAQGVQCASSCHTYLFYI